MRLSLRGRHDARTSPEGEKYDGRMTQIVAHHIALVEAGRAGPDVMVADAVLQSRIRLP